jgi:hypothetical protein
MANEIFVTLTDSENTFLSYPCRGWLELFEIGSNGSIINGVFRQMKEDGTSSGAVHVRNVMFSFNYRDVHFRNKR